MDEDGVAGSGGDDYGGSGDELYDKAVNVVLQDKKVSDGKLTFILARGIGQAFITRDVPREVLHKLLSDALASRR